MLRLYDYLPSQNAWKVRLLLSHLGLKCERVPVSIFEGESRTDAYLDKNPAGAVPVLEVEPGQCIAESNAILCYLAEGTGYLPEERIERARVMQWLFFEQSYVEPQIGSLRYWTLTGKLAKRSEDMIAGKRAYSLRALRRWSDISRRVSFL
jgi:glutathione S-transferase